MCTEPRNPGEHRGKTAIAGVDTLIIESWCEFPTREALREMNIFCPDCKSLSEIEIFRVWWIRKGAQMISGSDMAVEANESACIYTGEDNLSISSSESSVQTRHMSAASCLARGLPQRVRNMLRVVGFPRAHARRVMASKACFILFGSTQRFKERTMIAIAVEK